MKTLLTLAILFAGYLFCTGQNSHVQSKYKGLQTLMNRAVYNDQVSMNLQKNQTAIVRFKVTKTQRLIIDNISTGNLDLDRALSSELSGKKISDANLIADRPYKIKVTFFPK